jgi:hypothetical protein
MEAVGLAMNLPTSYKELSIEEEIAYWQDSGVDEEIVDAKIDYLESLAGLPFQSQYFIDTANLANDIRITRSALIKVGKYFSKEGFLVVNEAVQKQGQFLGITYDVLDNTYFSLENGNDVIQIRYRATQRYTRTAGFFQSSDETNVFYTTFYVVSGKRTVMMAVNHESEDFEYFIRSVRFLE